MSKTRWIGKYVVPKQGADIRASSYAAMRNENSVASSTQTSSSSTQSEKPAEVKSISIDTTSSKKYDYTTIVSEKNNKTTTRVIYTPKGELPKSKPEYIISPEQTEYLNKYAERQSAESRKQFITRTPQPNLSEKSLYAATHSFKTQEENIMPVYSDMGKVMGFETGEGTNKQSVYYPTRLSEIKRMQREETAQRIIDNTKKKIEPSILSVEQFRTFEVIPSVEGEEEIQLPSAREEKELPEFKPSKEKGIKGFLGSYIDFGSWFARSSKQAGTLRTSFEVGKGMMTALNMAASKTIPIPKFDVQIIPDSPSIHNKISAVTKYTKEGKPYLASNTEGLRNIQITVSPPYSSISKSFNVTDITPVTAFGLTSISGASEYLRTKGGSAALTYYGGELAAIGVGWFKAGKEWVSSTPLFKSIPRLLPKALTSSKGLMTTIGIGFGGGLALDVMSKETETERAKRFGELTLQGMLFGAGYKEGMKIYGERIPYSKEYTTITPKENLQRRRWTEYINGKKVIREQVLMDVEIKKVTSKQTPKLRQKPLDYVGNINSRIGTEEGASILKGTEKVKFKSPLQNEPYRKSKYKVIGREWESTSVVNIGYNEPFEFQSLSTRPKPTRKIKDLISVKEYKKQISPIVTKKVYYERKVIVVKKSKGVPKDIFVSSYIKVGKERNIGQKVWDISYPATNEPLAINEIVDLRRIPAEYNKKVGTVAKKRTTYNIPEQNKAGEGVGGFVLLQKQGTTQQKWLSVSEQKYRMSSPISISKIETKSVTTQLMGSKILSKSSTGSKVSPRTATVSLNMMLNTSRTSNAIQSYPRTRNEVKPLSAIKPILDIRPIMNIKPISSQSAFTETRPIFDVKPISELKPISEVRPISMSRAIQSVKPISRIRAIERVKPFDYIPLKETGKIKIPTINFNAKITKGSSKQFSIQMPKFKEKRTPTIEGTLFKFKGSYPKTITGIEIRPI